MHTIVRVSEKVEGRKLSMEERLQLVENELGKMRQLVENELEKMRQLLAKLVEKGSEGSSGNLITEGARPSGGGDRN